MNMKPKKRNHNRNNRNSDGLNSFKEIKRDFRKKRQGVGNKIIYGSIAFFAKLGRFVMRYILPSYEDKEPSHSKYYK